MPSDVVDMEVRREKLEDVSDPGLSVAAVLSWLASVRFYNIWRLLVLWPSKSISTPEKLRPTAYLDGIRGFAAFLVYWHHHQLWAHNPMQKVFIESGWGYLGRYHFMSFPFVRIFFQGGHFAVGTFFVISGYVLSAKPLSLIHAGEQAKLADNVGSALFRRWLRLYIPIFATTWIHMTFSYATGMWLGSLTFTLKKTYLGQMWDWWCQFKNFSFLFYEGDRPSLSYNYHLWSIPIEMKGSIIIYAAVLALAKCNKNARLWFQGLLIFYFLYIVDGWYCALFMAGMLLNDLQLLESKQELPEFFDRFRPYKTLIFYHLFVVALYLGGVPAHKIEIEDLRTNPGWYYLSFLKSQSIFDPKWFYIFFAATFLVASVAHIGWLKRFFETRFCQYLGRISFSLYLVHGPILETLGDRVYTAIGWHTELQESNLPQWVDLWVLPKTGPLGLELSFLAPHIIFLPITLYAAEVVTRAFDEPSLRFPQWLYKSTLGRPSVRLPA
ncbi:acyltransferase family-domain-containing protein [Cladorrhinum sp. PSN259]|nr:acyltransferase family-domain-containing protein [Cladorrhinum sp. PSN259]